VILKGLTLMLASVHTTEGGPQMTGATHTRSPMEQRLLRDRRRGRLIAVAAVTAVAALLVALALALDGGDSASTDTNPTAGHANQPPVPQTREPGVRYDGGPEEGTADLSPSLALVTESQAFPGLAGLARAAQADRRRYDGGPEEGTRGPHAGSPSPASRYDGGPEEGTRGPAR
jgi:hypothetical protein